MKASPDLIMPGSRLRNMYVTSEGSLKIEFRCARAAIKTARLNQIASRCGYLGKETRRLRVQSHSFSQKALFFLAKAGLFSYSTPTLEGPAQSVS